TQAAAVSQSSTLSGSNTAAQLSHVVNSTPSALQSLATNTTTTNAASTTTGAATSTGVGLPSVPPSLTDWNTIWSTLTGPYSLQGWTAIPGGPFLSFGQAYAWGQNGQGAAAYLAGPKAISGALAPLTSGAS